MCPSIRARPCQSLPKHAASPCPLASERMQRLMGRMQPHSQQPDSFSEGCAMTISSADSFCGFAPAWKPRTGLQERLYFAKLFWRKPICIGPLLGPILSCLEFAVRKCANFANPFSKLLGTIPDFYVQLSGKALHPSTKTLLFDQGTSESLLSKRLRRRVPSTLSLKCSFPG